MATSQNAARTLTICLEMRMKWMMPMQTMRMRNSAFEIKDLGLNRLYKFTLLSRPKQHNAKP